MRILFFCDTLYNNRWLIQSDFFIHWSLHLPGNIRLTSPSKFELNMKTTVNACKTLTFKFNSLTND